MLCLRSKFIPPNFSGLNLFKTIISNYFIEIWVLITLNQTDIQYLHTVSINNYYLFLTPWEEYLWRLHRYSRDLSTYELIGPNYTGYIWYPDSYCGREIGSAAVDPIVVAAIAQTSKEVFITWNRHKMPPKGNVKVKIVISGPVKSTNKINFQTED